MRNKVLIFVLLVLLALSIYMMTNSKPKLNNKYAGGNYSFKLNTINGKITNNDFKGKVVILFFGYTNCPDICPTALADLKNAYKNLSENEIKQTQVIFIGVDPKRDTLKVLNEYVKYFNKNFIGATSNEKYLHKLASNFYAYFRYDSKKNSAGGYAVSHTARLYLLDKDGNLANTLGTNKIKVKLISDSIKELL